MRRTIGILLILAFICAALAGCAMTTGLREPQETKEAPTLRSPDEKEPAPGPEAAAQMDLTLADIKKAAEAAGYLVSDGHQYILMDDLIGGITIEIVADGSHTLYSVAECATEEAAERNAKEIDDAGYAHALCSGKFISSYDAENKGTERKKLLSAILAGKPLPAPAYPAGTQSNSAQAKEASPGSNLGGIPAYDPRAIPDDGIQQREGFVENGALYIKIRGIEKTQLGDKPGIILNYEMTNLSEESIDTQALYVEVLQNGEELRHPFTFEPAYLTIPELAPRETLAFHDEYLLASETEAVEARIRQLLVMVSNPPWVVQTFDLG